MAIGTGPGNLPQFEDRLLYHLVDLTGDRPMGVGEGISEADLAIRLAGELKISVEFPRTGEFHSSAARGTVVGAVKALEDEGLVDADPVMGPWTIRPTWDGRRRVGEWRRQWEQRRETQDRGIQQRILEELNRQWRTDPARHQMDAKVDVERLCAELDITREDYLANAQRLRAQGKIAESSIDQLTLRDGYAHITEAGIQTLEAVMATQRRQRDAQEAWVEVARPRRKLQNAERTLPSLIADAELRRRSQDLLAAEGDYDRVVREACVVLEDRVRVPAGAESTLVGVQLMDRAFNPKSGLLRLSSVEQEQTGALHLYRGVMAFFRNAAGHRLIGTYSQEDALRFVVWIDLLLGMVAAASASLGEAEPATFLSPLGPSDGTSDKGLRNT